jgi:hypothetical protein
VIGWTIVALGPVLALLAYSVVRRQSRSGEPKLAQGAAAMAGLLWFLVTAEWLPPAWKSFWSDHSISAGVVSSALALAAGWIFIDVRQQHLRSASLYANWGNWLRGQERALAKAIRLVEADPGGMPAIAHLSVAAGIRAELMVQQQWAASTHTVFLVRPTSKEDQGLLNGLTLIRRHGGAAIRELTKLEVFLAQLGAATLPIEESTPLWKPSQDALENLRAGVEAHESFVNHSRFAAAHASGQRS